VPEHPDRGRPVHQQIHHHSVLNEIRHFLRGSGKRKRGSRNDPQRSQQIVLRGIQFDPDGFEHACDGRNTGVQTNSRRQEAALNFPRYYRTCSHSFPECNVEGRVNIGWDGRL